MKMKAAILAAQRQPLVIDDVELPPRLLPGQVLVKVYYTSVCGSQVAMIDGKRGFDPWCPKIESQPSPTISICNWHLCLAARSSPDWERSARHKLNWDNQS
ncbi:MAG: hypothetical protein O7E52_18835 [Candidatus Poribacteria bacterium]|nr:hypothetical protein [Candidatus Poribacteria bacterium]